MATHPLNTKDDSMFNLHICRTSGERIGTCECASCRLARGEAVDLPTRQHAGRAGQGGEA